MDPQKEKKKSCTAIAADAVFLSAIAAAVPAAAFSAPSCG
jgi:hypothetical protein